MDDDECDIVGCIHPFQDKNKWNTSINTAMTLLFSGVPRGGLGGSNLPPPPEIPKALQNRAKLN